MTGGELKHYGVKGMKWGVRRYENEDGSLTPAGKRKLKEARKKIASDAYKGTKANIKNAKKAGLKRLNDSTDLLPKGTELRRITDANETLDDNRKFMTFTDKDLRKYVNIALRGGLSMDLNKAHIDRYKAKKDLKIANEKEAFNFVYEQVKDKKIKDILIPEEYNERLKFGDYDVYKGKLDFYNKHKDMKVSSFKYDFDIAPNYKESRYDWLMEDYSGPDEWAIKRMTLGNDLARGILTQKGDMKMSRFEESFDRVKNAGYDAVNDIFDFGAVENPWTYYDDVDYPLVVLNPGESLERK